MSTHDTDKSSNAPEGQDYSPMVAFAMGEIKGEVKNLRSDLADWKNDLRADIQAGDIANTTKIADLETRMRALEKWKWIIAGAAAAGGTAGGKIIDFLSKVSAQ